MRRLITTLLLLLLASSAAAQAPWLGVGVVLGEPTGISVKLWQGTGRAFDFAAGWSLGKSDEIYIHGEYVLHKYGWSGVRSGKFPFYYGVGARIIVKEDHETSFGVRVPLGLNYIFEDAPIDLFVEFVPLLDLTPDTDVDIDAAIGIRYLFR